MNIKRIAIGAAVAGGVMGVSAFAMAAFTADTTPFSAHGEAGTVLQANADGEVVGTLMPGYYNDVQFTVNNPNSFPLVIDRVSLDEAYGTSGIVVPASSTADFQAGLDLMGWDANGPGSLEAKGTVVPAGGSAVVTLTDALGMGTWATDASQGATIELPLIVDFTVPTGTDAGL